MSNKQIFISYSREDAAEFAVSILSKILKDIGFEAWVDDRGIPPGTIWTEEIDKAIKDSLATIVVITPGAAKSQNVTYEYAFARGSGKRVIPVLRESAP